MSQKRAREKVGQALRDAIKAKESAASTSRQEEAKFLTSTVPNANAISNTPLEEYQAWLPSKLGKGDDNELARGSKRSRLDVDEPSTSYKRKRPGSNVISFSKGKWGEQLESPPGVPLRSESTPLAQAPLNFFAGPSTTLGDKSETAMATNLMQQRGWDQNNTTMNCPDATFMSLQSQAINRRGQDRAVLLSSFGSEPQPQLPFLSVQEAPTRLSLMNIPGIFKSENNQQVQQGPQQEKIDAAMSYTSGSEYVAQVPFQQTNVTQATPFGTDHDEWHGMYSTEAPMQAPERTDRLNLGSSSWSSSSNIVSGWQDQLGKIPKGNFPYSLPKQSQSAPSSATGPRPFLSDYQQEKLFDDASVSSSIFEEDNDNEKDLSRRRRPEKASAALEAEGHVPEFEGSHYGHEATRQKGKRSKSPDAARKRKADSSS